MEINPFRRRGMILRSPPRGRSSSVSEINLAFMAKTEDNPAKRKRAETPHEIEDDKLSPLIKRIIEKIDGLKAEIKVHVNKKTTIKRGVEDIGRLVGRLKNIDPVAGCMKVSVDKPKMASMKSIGVQTTVRTQSIGVQTTVDTQYATVTTSTQTYTCDEEEEKATKGIWEIIKEEKSWERCEEVMFRTWPSSAYRVTMEVDSNPLKLSGDRNLCVYVNNRVDINKGLAKQLREKINDLWELDGEGRPVEGITYMTQTIKKPNREYTDKFTCMLSAPSKSTAGTGVTDMGKVYRHMEAIKEEVLANGKEKLAFIPL
nr:unnamed protein product [Callosobruchus analis]